MVGKTEMGMGDEPRSSLLRGEKVESERVRGILRI